MATADIVSRFRMSHVCARGPRRRVPLGRRSARAARRRPRTIRVTGLAKRDFTVTDIQTHARHVLDEKLKLGRLGHTDVPEQLPADGADCSLRLVL